MSSEYWTEKYRSWEQHHRDHAGHAFNTDHLLEIEEHLPRHVDTSVETGCGKSTILLSNISGEHHVFALDDRSEGANSSVMFFEDCPLTNLNHLIFHFGPTQVVLPTYVHEARYDIVLLDGPHGFPFPELEYYYLYPHIKEDGLLIIDDINIPTIGRLADFIAEDEMFTLEEVVRTTALFRRTSADLFDPLGDGWWTQKYNRRRVSSKRDIFLPADNLRELITAMHLDRRLHGDLES